MNTFTLIFLIAIAAGTLLKWWLAARQLASVADHRDRVPEAFRESISLETHQTAADYTVVKTRAGILETGYAVLLLLLWTLGGGIDLLHGVWASSGLPPLLAGTLVLAGALSASAAAAVAVGGTAARARPRTAHAVACPSLLFPCSTVHFESSQF